MRPFAPLLYCLLAFPFLAYTASPPDKLTLLVPPSQVQVNSLVCLGWAEPADSTRYYGFIEAVNISMIAPNGTNIGSVTHSTNAGLGCTTYPGSSYSGCAVASDTGKYTVVWNFTYTISSDPAQANESYCGPAPFSTQVFLLNETFEATLVQGEGTSFTNTEFTRTTTLPTKPTGNLRVAGASAVHLPEVIGWMGATAVAVGMMLMM